MRLARRMVRRRYGLSMEPEAATLISIDGTGGSLTVVVRRQTAMTPDEPWFDAEIAVEAPPFSGTLNSVFTKSDLRQWGEGLAALRGGTGRVVLGGGRAAELVLDGERQIGGPADSVTIAVDLVPSGDDPYPKLSFLIFDVPSSWSEVAPGAMNRD